MPHRALRTAIGAIVLAIALTWPGIASAETSKWSAPVLLSPAASRPNWFPDIAADDVGNVHVVWNGMPPDVYERIKNRGDEDAARASLRDVGALFYTHWDGRSWSTPNDVALVWWNNALRSSIAVDRLARLHLTYKGYGRSDSTLLQAGLGEEQIWHTSAPPLGAESIASWLKPMKLSRSLGYFSDTEVDSKGTLHAMWSEGRQGTWTFYYARSSDGGLTWGHPQSLAVDDDMVWWYRAQLFVDSRDRLHAVWEVTDRKHLGITRGVVYARSDDGGTTWKRTSFGATDGSADGAGPQQPAVGVDGTGTTLLVSRDAGSQRIVYRRSDDGVVWTDPTPLPGVRAGVSRPYDMYSMITDSAGRVHLALAGYPTDSEAMHLLHYEWDGVRWSAPSTIATATATTFPEYPKLALSAGNHLHVAWYERDGPGDENNPLGIWYSTASTDAPADVRRVPVAGPDRFAATPTPTRVVSPTPAPTPVRDRFLDDETDDARSHWVEAIQQRADLAVLAALSAAAIVLTSIGVAAVRWR